MIKGTSEELADLVRRYKCPEHDNPLNAAWDAKENSLVIRCGAGHCPEEVVKAPTLTDLHKQGVELPDQVRRNVEKGMAKRAGAVARQSIPLELAGLPSEDLGTHAALSVTQRQALIDYARHYGLDAYRGHVMFMFGKPYIGIDGYLYHARTRGWTYQLHSRPLTDDERTAMQLVTGDHGWKAEITTLPDQGYFIGIGIVTKKEMEEPSKKDPSRLAAPVVAAHPWLLAQKRAEWQALRRAFPIGEESGPPVAAPPPVPLPPVDPVQVGKDIAELWPT
jgi:hypothetical protein